MNLPIIIPALVLAMAIGMLAYFRWAGRRLDARFGAAARQHGSDSPQANAPRTVRPASSTRLREAPVTVSGSYRAVDARRRKGVR